MKSNEIKEKYRELLFDEIEDDPDIRRGRKLTGILLVIWLAARLLFFLSELLCVKIGFMPFQFSNLLALIIALLWAAVLNNGVKYLPILPLAGGVFMLIRAFRERAFYLLSLNLCLELDLYYSFYLLITFGQIAIMLCLLLLPSCEKYAAAGSRIRKKLKNEPDGPHL
jgi:hypothetical protein